MRISDWSSDVCSSDLILGPRAGTMRQMGEDPRTVRDASDRGAGEAKAAAERQPQRGMFDGFRPAPQHPAPEPTPASEREKATPKRSAERRVGKGCVSTCKYRWSP